MGLREMMKEKELITKPEDNSTERLELIQALNLEISKLQSEKQGMLTMLKEQDVKLKEQTKYVEESKKNELDNKRLLSETQKALQSSDNDKRRAEQALRHAQNEAERAKQAQEQARQESQERYRAEEQARKVKQDTESSIMTYKSLFIGNGIFTVVLAFFVAFSKQEVFMDMLKWFPLRWNNLKSFLSWIATMYMAAIQFIGDKWELKIWNYVMVSIVALVIGFILFFIASYLVFRVVDFAVNVESKCMDTFLKEIISGNIALAMFFSCLFFSDPIKSIIPLNIFSVWLIFSFIGIGLWHIPEIKDAIQDKY